jgi:hypothetical protein
MNVCKDVRSAEHLWVMAKRLRDVREMTKTPSTIQGALRG